MSVQTIPVGQRVTILVDDAAGRFHAGEIGTVLEHDFDKYVYFVQLAPTTAEIDTTFYHKGDLIGRNFFFYESEVCILTNTSESNCEG